MSKKSLLEQKKEQYEGKIYPTKKFGDVVILEYISGNKALIKFLNTGHIVEENWSSIRSGYIKDGSIPTTCGFGFIDIEGASIGRVHTKEYSIWNGMIQRCYNENIQQTHPTYKDCIVDVRWKYFSVFKDWCNKQIGFNQNGWQLDKDILSKGSKVYSPETCCFVPNEINCALPSSKKVRGNLPQGVIWNCTKTRYRARIQRKDKWESLGTYDTPEEAFLAYKPVKETHIKSLAEKYKDQIDPRAYDALMNWSIEITD